MHSFALLQVTDSRVNALRMVTFVESTLYYMTYITDAFEGDARPARVTAKLISRLGSLAKRLKERPELRLIFENNVQINFPIIIPLPNTLILLLTRDLQS